MYNVHILPTVLDSVLSIKCLALVLLHSDMEWVPVSGKSCGEQTGISRHTLARIHGLTVFAEWLASGLACGDQRQRTGSDSALEALRDDALYKYTFTLLTYFTVVSFTFWWCYRFCSIETAVDDVGRYSVQTLSVLWQCWLLIGIAFGLYKVLFQLSHLFPLEISLEKLSLTWSTAGKLRVKKYESSDDGSSSCISIILQAIR